MARARCDGCRVLKKQLDKTIRSNHDLQRYQFAFPERRVSVGHKFCAKCRAATDRISKDGTQSQSEGPCASRTGLLTLRDINNSSNANPDFADDGNPLNGDLVPGSEQAELIQMPFKRVVLSGASCFICGSTTRLQRVSPQLRTQVFSKWKLIVPRNNLCCDLHLIKKRLFKDQLEQLRPDANTAFVDEEDFMVYIKMLAEESDAPIRDKVGTLNLTDEQVEVMTGLTHDNIIVLASMMTSLRNPEGQSITQALIIFLFKICSGSSNALIASIFGLENAEQVSRTYDAVIKCFDEDVLPSRFGFAARKRKDLIRNETSDLFKQLFEVTDRLALICDGSFHRYSEVDSYYQKKSFSVQKQSHLCKQLVISTTSGYVVDIIRPFDDESSAKTALEQSSALGELLSTGDVCFIDRASCRDVTAYLKQKGVVVHMPPLKDARKQLNTTDSNFSRFVTKVRWVVDAVNGIIKRRYRILNHRLDDEMLSKVGVLTKIAFFLNNRFGKRLRPDQAMFDKVVESMRRSRHTRNSLDREADVNKWNTIERPWCALNPHAIPDFPQLTVEDLIIHLTGAYQLSQSVSYLMELQNKDNTFNIKIHDDKSRVVKLEVQSRHVEGKAYKCYIGYIPGSDKSSGITSHFCECLNGTRTVGCCSHVAASLLYLSYARWLSEIIKPAKILLSLSHDGASVPVIDEDSDED